MTSDVNVKPSRAGSAIDIHVVQVRTRFITGLPEQYRGVTVEARSGKVVLESASWTRQADGTVACEFWARLPYPPDGVIDLKAVPVSPWSRPQLAFWARGRCLFGGLDLGKDAEDGAEAQQGRGVEGGGGTWRSAVVQLHPRWLVDRVRGKKPQACDVKLHIDYFLLTLPGRLARLPELELAIPLGRPLHCYAHGGFMGAALSLLADPQWSTMLMEILGEEDDKMKSHIVALDTLHSGGVTTAKLDMLPLMLALENSPVLCAYGLVRSGCLQAPAGVLPLIASGAALVAPSSDCGWRAFKLAPPERVPLLLRPQLHDHPIHRHHYHPGHRGPSPLGPAFNRYGYAPLGLEWDLWLSPDDPAALSLAVVDHGSAGDLVQQAIAMALRCDTVAKSMGRRHNKSQGISPVRWLRDFASGLNQSVMRDVNTPVPLYGPARDPGGGGAAAAAADLAAAAAALVPYPDGGACPTLESFIRLVVGSLCLRLSPQQQERQPVGKTAVRVRVVGNTHTHDRLLLDRFQELPELQGEGDQGAEPGSPGRSGLAKTLNPLRPVITLPSPAGSVRAAAAADATALADAGAGPAAGVEGVQPKLYACMNLPGNGGATGAGAPPPQQQPGALSGSFYPVEPADLGRTVLVIEVMNSTFSGRLPVARAVVPLSVLRGRGEGGALTFTAALHTRKHIDPVDDAPAAPLADPEPRATEAQSPKAPAMTGAASPPQLTPGPVAEGMQRISAEPAAAGAPPPAQSMQRPTGPEGARPPAEAALELTPMTGSKGKEPGEPVPAATSLQYPYAAGAPLDLRGIAQREKLRAATSRRRNMSLRIDSGSASLRPDGSRHGAGAHTTRKMGASLIDGLRMSMRGSMRRKDAAEVLGLQHLHLDLESSGESSDDDGSGHGSDSDSDEDGLEDAVPEGDEDAYEEEEEGAGGAATEGVQPGEAVDVFVAADSMGAAACRRRLAESGRGSVTLTLRWETLSVLQAAQQLHGLPPSVAQSCTAMLSRPGGLYLDVKSGYSRAPHLRSFASTLAGIGIHVKAICSFVPKQIDYEELPHPGLSPGLSAHPTPATPGGRSPNPAAVTLAAQRAPSSGLPPAAPAPSSTKPATSAASLKTSLSTALSTTGTGDGGGLGLGGGPVIQLPASRVPSLGPRIFDTVLFFHGLNGLELACEAGRVAPGTCVLFNGASMLSEDPGAAVTAPLAAPSEELVEGLEERELEQQQLDQQEQCRLEAVQAQAHAQTVPALAQAVAEGNEGPEGSSGPAPMTAEALQSSAPAPGAVPQAEGGSAPAGVDAGYGSGRKGHSGGGAKVPIVSGASLPVLVDKEAWRRYCTVVDIFNVYGGIYVQEPDCCPAAVDALVELTNSQPEYLPLGFAYGHISHKAVAAAGHSGRGMAAQQLLEELAARKALSNKVQKWINQGVHVGASDQVYLSWGRRLLTGDTLLYRRQQVLLLRLLADYDYAGAPGSSPDDDGKQRLAKQGAALLHLINGLGGLEFLYYRFHQHYEATSPVTFLEIGFNLNYTKAMVRLLRNRGALAALSPQEKAATAVWLATAPKLRLWVVRCFLRAGRHKLVKEALTCLVESCTEEEFQQICTALGGRHILLRCLRGWTRIFGWSYLHRLHAAEKLWQDGHADTSLIAAGKCDYGFVLYARRVPGGELAPGQGLEEAEAEGAVLSSYAGSALGVVGGLFRRRGPKKPRLARAWVGPDGVVVVTDPRHTRIKPWMITLWRLVRKWFCCFCTLCWNCCLMCSPLTCCCYTICVCPVLCFPYCKSRLLVFVLAVLAVVFMFLLSAGVIGGTVTAEKAAHGKTPAYAAPPAPAPAPL